MTWTLQQPILVWGLSCGRVALPAAIAKQFSSNPNLVGILQSPSICPECLYLPHDSALCGGTLLASGNVEARERKRPNPGKKCSQCQRVLPIDPRLAAYRKTQDACKRAPRNMVVAFHGHRSKRTGYQNECRSCKNVEINGHFNVIRTADQFHESSTLTRERKLLLRESEVLKEFKQRQSKEGLRSFIWHRFEHKCFRCGNAVGLQEFELDHTRPLAYLWPLDEHATCLCGSCNNAKKDAFPADYYSPDEIARLAAIANQHDVSVDVGVQQKVDPTDTAALDALMAQVQQITDQLRLGRLDLPGGASAIWVKTENDPIYSPDHLQTKQVFTSVLTFTFRVVR